MLNKLKIMKDLTFIYILLGTQLNGIKASMCALTFLIQGNFHKTLNPSSFQCVPQRCYKQHLVLIPHVLPKVLPFSPIQVGQKGRIFFIFPLFSTSSLQVPKGSHQVFNMFPRFPMCSPKVFPIAHCFNPTCFAQSPPLLTYTPIQVRKRGRISFIFPLFPTCSLQVLNEFSLSFQYVPQVPNVFPKVVPNRTLL